MRGTEPASRLALIFRRLRGRFGISAPKVSVRTEHPWYWRAAVVVMLSGVALALAGWVYDTGRRFSGFNQNSSEQELAGLRSRVSELEAELARTSKLANSSDSRLTIESTTQDRLAAQVKSLEAENIQLRADIAMFENIAGGDTGAPSVEISRVEVVPTGTAGSFRYRILLAYKGGTKGREFKGRLRLKATLQRGTETAIIEIPGKNEAFPKQLELSFRLFSRVEGEFSVPAGSKVKQVEALVLEGGHVRAVRSTTL